MKYRKYCAGKTKVWLKLFHRISSTEILLRFNSSLHIEETITKSRIKNVTSYPDACEGNFVEYRKVGVVERMVGFRGLAFVALVLMTLVQLIFSGRSIIFIGGWTEVCAYWFDKNSGITASPTISISLRTKINSSVGFNRNINCETRYCNLDLKLSRRS
jgi:hypothetical protein